MSTISEAPPAITIEAPDLYRLTVDQYERMVELEFLDDPRVELIDGLLVTKMTKHPPHTLAIERLRRRLEAILPTGWYVREEKPVRIPEHDEPEPDLAVARGNPDSYAARNPGPSDVSLIVEIAESSLRRDRGEKLRAYARGGIPEYWIVNLVDRVVERHSQPDAREAAYQARHVLGLDESVPVVIQGTEVGTIGVAGILP